MKLKILYFIIMLAFFASGCKKSYLDSKPTEYISTIQLAEAAKTDPGLLDGNIAGLYSTMYNTGTGGTDLDHDDFGQKGYDIYTDMLQSDLVLGALNYGWYSNVARYTATVDYTRNENYKPWRYYYRIVFGANTVIDALGGTDAVPESDEQKHIMGQAKTMRAYAYFYLAQLFAKGYNESEKILPIYTDTEVPNQPKSTAKEVYDLIIDDLTEAIGYLETFERATKDQVDKWVAKGLLAYALSARGTNADLQQVVTLTNEITAQYPLTTKKATVLDVAAGETVATNPEAGFNNIASPSWMWGVDLTLAIGLDLVSWWGQVDVFTYSYAWAGDPKSIDLDLYHSIPNDDIRKKQFATITETATSYVMDPPDEDGDYTAVPVNKFFDPARVIGRQRNVITDYVYMRADEFILLNAEANARLSQDNDARNSLKKLLALRVDNYAYVDNLAGVSLLDEIYHQTRIELWGEGKAYLAMKRLKKDVKRGPNHLFSAGETLKYDDPKLTFSIPQSEVQNNPNLDE